MLRNGFMLSFLTLCLAVIGCGDGGPELAEVTGVIKLDGNPAPKLTIRFLPTAEGASPSYGATNAEGEYTLLFTSDKAGAMIGAHDVEIEPVPLEYDDNGELIPDQNIPEIPARYMKKGTLTAEVKAGDNTINFDLQSSAE